MPGSFPIAILGRRLFNHAGTRRPFEPVRLLAEYVGDDQGRDEALHDAEHEQVA